MFETDLQKVQYLDKYARWNPTHGRRETWEETCERVMLFLRGQLNKKGYPKAARFNTIVDWSALEQGMLNLDVLPSMRVVQMAGPALERCNVGAYNCSYLPLKDWQAFSELLYILMQGTGAGFSVEQRYIDELPPIQPQDPTYKTYFQIPDTTEGWCDALRRGLEVWSSGGDIEFDYSRIRPIGSVLKTKGGTASGPQPLKDLLEFARKLLLAHQGRKLSSLNAHDLATFCGSIVQVGGVRRAAEISLSDLGDEKMRHAKDGQFWQKYPERSMANNSAVYNIKPTWEEFQREWSALVASGSGERGIFNRGGVNAMLPIRREPRDDWGLNPCGEIILRPFEFCNLSIAVARPDDTLESLTHKVRLATQFGILQSILTDFNYLRPEWKQNCEEERLLGVDITGQMDCALFQFPGTYSVLRSAAIAEAATLADQLHIPMPAAITCVKPSGNSSQLLGVSSGIHPRYSKYYIRRLRIGAESPVAKLLIASGVPYHAEVGQRPDNPAIWVFEFPVKSPDGAVTRNDVTALDQLRQWQSCKLLYTEHNPSCTIYVDQHEWESVGRWVYEHWDTIGGLSFLPKDNTVYMLAPYEEITEEKYYELADKWPVIDFTRLSEWELSDTTTVNNEYACVGGVCEL